MYNTILFDLDGTLTDSAPGIYNAVIYALREMGLEIPSSEELRTFIGPPLLESFDQVCALRGDDGKEALRLYRVYYNEKGLYENRVYDGISECLENLKKAGKRLAVATSKPESFAVRIIEHFGLEKYFDLIAGATMDESRNAKPGVIAYALEKLGIRDTKEVLMIGDRRHDAEGAALFGIDCLGVLFGFGTREELLQAGVEMLAATPDEITEIILGKTQV